MHTFTNCSGRCWNDLDVGFCLKKARYKRRTQLLFQHYHVKSILSHVHLTIISSIKKQPNIILISLKKTTELVKLWNSAIHLSTWLNVQLRPLTT